MGWILYVQMFLDFHINKGRLFEETGAKGIRSRRCIRLVGYSAYEVRITKPWICVSVPKMLCAVLMDTIHLTVLTYEPLATTSSLFFHIVIVDIIKNVVLC